MSLLNWDDDVAFHQKDKNALQFDDDMIFALEL